MADICKLCDKRIGFFGKAYTAVNEILCEDCRNSYRKALDSAYDNPGKFNDYLNEFQTKFQDRADLDKFVKHLNEVYDATLKKIEHEENNKKYGDDFYMQCELCKHVFHYTKQDLMVDAEMIGQAAKQEMFAGLNMIGGNMLAGKIDALGTEGIKANIPDRSKCPKCGNSKLKRISEEEAKAEIEKLNTPAQIVTATSAADELKKFKELLDMGAITQEEFEAKKKQLLGL